MTANAAIDRTLRVERLTPGALHSAVSDHAQAGGKGVNVARLVRALGLPVHAIVVVGGEAGSWIVRDLERAGIPSSAVWAPGESRTCLEILETGRARATQIHGEGVAADARVAEALLAQTAQLAGRAAWVALSGSLARGLPVETAAGLVKAARAAGAKVALDTHGRALQGAWRQGPNLVRINRDELAQALGVRPRDVPPAPYPSLGFTEYGVISNGSGPIVAFGSEEPPFCLDPPRIAARNTIGCGDAMLAGLLAALATGRSFREALLAATALAAAQAESWNAGALDLARAKALERELAAGHGEPPKSGA